MPAIRKIDFVGKTIRKMDTSACNQVTFWFTDGTVTALETEPVVLGLSAIVRVSKSDLPTLLRRSNHAQQQT